MLNSIEFTYTDGIYYLISHKYWQNDIKAAFNDFMSDIAEKYPSSPITLISVVNYFNKSFLSNSDIKRFNAIEKERVSFSKEKNQK